MRAGCRRATVVGGDKTTGYWLLTTDYWLRSILLHLPGLDVGQALLEARGIRPVGLAARDGLLADSDSLLLLAHRQEELRLRRKVLESLLDLDRLLDPLQSVFKLVVVEVRVADGERYLPVVRVGGDRRVDLRHRDGVHVRHLDREGDGYLLPAQHDLRRVRGHLRDFVGENLLRLRRPRGLDLHAQRILLRVVAVAAPLIRLLVEDERPLFFAGDGVQAVGAGGELLAVD